MSLHTLHILGGMSVYPQYNELIDSTFVQTVRVSKYK